MTQEWHQLLKNEYIDLQLCLTSGQCFTYVKDEETYVIELSTISIVLKEIDKIIYFLCDHNNKEFIETLLKDFFTLHIQYEQLFGKWNIKYTGLRLLKIDIVECIFTFICSQNNNIKRIKKMADILKNASNDFTYFKFENLNGFGYRERYIKEAGIKIQSIIANNLKSVITDNKFIDNQSVINDTTENFSLNEIKQYLYSTIRDHHNMDVASFIESFAHETSKTLKFVYFCFVNSILLNYNKEKAEEFLLSFKGIGRKVCDCILLNGYGFYDVVPQDVHMLRVSKNLGFSGTKQEINEQYIERYGEYCGIAQIYLFNDSVTNKIKLTSEKRKKKVK